MLSLSTSAPMYLCSTFPSTSLVYLSFHLLHYSSSLLSSPFPSSIAAFVCFHPLPLLYNYPFSINIFSLFSFSYIFFSIPLITSSFFPYSHPLHFPYLFFSTLENIFIPLFFFFLLLCHFFMLFLSHRLTS